LIPSYYNLHSFQKKKESEVFRDFAIIKVIYAQKGQEIDKIIKVDNEKIPIWWMIY